MSKKKGRKRSNKKQLIVMSIMLVVLIVIAVVVYKKTSEKMQDQEQGQQTEETGIEFPYLLDEGRLEISSLFPYEGINPDCGNQEGTDIASVSLKNVSDEYLIEASISLMLDDGTEVNFVVKELPSGKSVMAFSTDNISISEDAKCVSASCETVYQDIDDSQTEKISTEVDGLDIIVTNMSEEAISEVTLYCHSPLDEEYFGGVAYQYTVNNLPANGSTTVSATECILGMAEVVRVEIK